MSEFPAHWDFKTIGEFSSRVRRKNTGGECQDPMTISAVDGLVSQRDYFNKIVASKNTEGYTLLHRNDFAYNKSYSDGYPVGAARRLKAKDKGIVSPLYICFELDRKQIDLQFADHLFDSDWFVQAIFGIAKEGARSHGLLNIGIEEFFSAQLPVPPLTEQKKIAEILSGIDKAIGIYEEQAKVLANMLDALMQEEIVMNTSTKWIKVGDACTAQAGGTPDRSQKGYYEGRIPWVKSGEVKGEDIFQTDESISNEAISNSSAKIVQSGSVLVAMYGATAGQTARLRIDAATNQAVLSLNSKTIELSNDYLYHSVTAFKNQLLLTCQGSGQPNLSSGLIKELEIPLPDQLVQQKISSALDSVRHRTLALRGKINSSKSLKNSIASDLLSGRKRVSV